MTALPNPWSDLGASNYVLRHQSELVKLTPVSGSSPRGSEDGSIAQCSRGFLVVKTIRRGRGFTLIEIASVLAVAAVIIAAVMIFFGTATNNRLAIEALDQAATGRHIIANYYEGQLGPSGIFNISTVLPTFGGWPNKWTKAGQTMTPWGSSLSVFFSNISYDNSPSNLICFRWMQVSSETCTQILQGISWAKNDVYSAYVASANLGVWMQQTTNPGVPLIEASCEGNTNDRWVEIDYRY